MNKTAYLIKRIFSVSLTSILLATLALPMDVVSAASNYLKNGFEELQVTKGDIETLKAKTLSRVSITDPDVADIVNATDTEVLVMGKQPGRTVLFMWDEFGKRTVIVNVTDESLDLVQARITRLLASANIPGVQAEVSPYEGRVILTGTIPEGKKEQFDVLVEPFADSLVNMVKENVVEDMVQIDVQITELNTTLNKNLGIDWGNLGENNENIGLTYQEENPALRGTDALFKIGSFARTSAILARVNMLVEEGKGQILSKPKLVVASGKEASFLVGGEIPIRNIITSVTGTLVQQDTLYKDYGVSLSVTPTLKNGKIEMLLNVEVSDVDASNQVGDDVAFLTRNASTQLILEDQQTIVIAGLIKKAKSETIKRVPFISSIPVVGLLFRNRQTPIADQDTELVISLTPTIIPTSERDETIAGTQRITSANVNPNNRIVVKTNLTTDEELSVPAVADQAQAAPAPEYQSSSVSQNLAPYAQLVQRRISEAISYPYRAKEQGWEGTVKLSMTLNRDGSLNDLTIKESSGYDVFDQDALNTARILSPYPVFPSNINDSTLVLTVPIVYSKDTYLTGRVVGPAAEVVVKEEVTQEKSVNESLDAQAAQDMVQESVASTDNVAEVAAAEPIIVEGKSYAELVQQKLAESIVYPEEAKEYGWEGTVRLVLHVLRDGTLAYVDVKESSGYEVFDQDAINLAKSAAPYFPFPPDSDAQEMKIIVPIVYSLN